MVQRWADSDGVGATEFRERFWSYLSPQQLGARLRQQRQRKQRSDIKVSEAGLIMGRVFHFMQRSGCASVHVAKVCGRKISDARISQRCQAMGVEIFEWVMGRILGPKADPTSRGVFSRAAISWGGWDALFDVQHSFGAQAVE